LWCFIRNTMCQRQPLAERSADQLMAQAMEYRRMALTATTVETREALIKLAIRLVALATLRKAGVARNSRGDSGIAVP
jgi:hypothetical protein